MTLKNRAAVTAGSLALLVVACSGCATDEPGTTNLPSYSSLEDARQAVAEHLGCREDPPGPTSVMGSNGQIPTESVKCTETVEIFYFETQDARDEAYALMSSAAGSKGSVYFAEGKNWFVVDYSEVGVGDGTTDPEPMDLSALSEPLGTRFTAAK